MIIDYKQRYDENFIRIPTSIFIETVSGIEIIMSRHVDINYKKKKKEKTYRYSPTTVIIYT